MPITINIKINTSITADNNSEYFNFKRVGYINYFDTFTEISYMEDKNTSVKLLIYDNDNIHLCRSFNSIQNKMIFMTNEETTTQYNTNTHSMSLTIKTIGIITNFNNSISSGDLSIDYNLFSDNYLIGEYSLSINFSK